MKDSAINLKAEEIVFCCLDNENEIIDNHLRIDELKFENQNIIGIMILKIFGSEDLN